METPGKYKTAIIENNYLVCDEKTWIKIREIIERTKSQIKTRETNLDDLIIRLLEPSDTIFTMSPQKTRILSEGDQGGCYDLKLVEPISARSRTDNLLTAIAYLFIELNKVSA